MSSKIDMSLDDIIKKSKAVKKGGQGNRGGSNPGRGNKNQRGGFGGRRNGPAKGGQRRNRVDGNRKVSNDSPRRGGIVSDSGPAKLVVSNLDFGVSDNDMRELFSDFGKLRSAAVHYDKSGKSLGSADVVFDRRSDAIKAMKQYNGVPLDGRPMKILLTTSDISVFSQVSNIPKNRGGRIEKRPANPKRRGGPGSKRGQRPAGKKGAGGDRKKEPVPTKEELDKDLDSYLASR